ARPGRDAGPGPHRAPGVDLEVLIAHPRVAWFYRTTGSAGSRPADRADETTAPGHARRLFTARSKPSPHLRAATRSARPPRCSM
ncbi:hypothetical protein, partial [Salmonella sp. S071_01786]|uniref:hypothetical protein n=1 Tax=Salmonella sp. S071_01786 TaxID=2665571 RepID=UPI001CA7D4F3